MLQWATTLIGWAAPAPAAPRPPAGDGVPVWVASTSTFSGKATARSTYERAGSIVP
jgi:hypothetical protein